MAIGTYAQLKSAVATWLHRTDLTSVIPDFVALAESRIRHDVRIRAMEASTSGSLSAATVALPTRFAEARRVVLDDQVLEYTPLTTFLDRDEWAEGVYSINGSNFVFPATSGAYEILYYAWFAAFSDDADTNDLLTYHPDVYLSACLAEAKMYIGGDPTPELARYAAAINRLRVSEQRAWGGPLTVRALGTENGYVP